MVEAETRGGDDPGAAPQGPPAACADGGLLLRHLQGDETAFPRLVQSWSGPLFSYLARSGIPAWEREDLFQDVFVKVHRAATSFDPARTFKPWLFAIAVNTVRNHLRAQSRAVFVDGDPAATERDPAPSVEAVLEAQETARFLEAQVEKLPLAQREVVLLCCVERISQAEVAEALDMPVNTVKTQLRRARLALAKGLASRGSRLDREVSG